MPPWAHHVAHSPAAAAAGPRTMSLRSLSRLPPYATVVQPLTDLLFALLSWLCAAQANALREP
jgi:hypothetical protein